MFQPTGRTFPLSILVSLIVLGALGETINIMTLGGLALIPQRNEFPVVLIAAGIGITPFISYLTSLRGDPAEPYVFLHHVCRDGSVQPFATQLDGLAKLLPKLSVTRYLSQPKNDDTCDLVGRFSAAFIDEDLIRARARFYLCAPDTLMDAVSADLQVRGVPYFEIFRERFFSPNTCVNENLAQQNVHFARSNRTLTWTPESGSLLAFAESAGLTLASGCRVGQCESCSVHILSGAVRHLSDCSNIEPGQCLTCQAVPVSDLVIDA